MHASRIRHTNSSSTPWSLRLSSCILRLTRSRWTMSSSPSASHGARSNPSAHPNLLSSSPHQRRNAHANRQLPIANRLKSAKGVLPPLHLTPDTLHLIQKRSVQKQGAPPLHPTPYTKTTNPLETALQEHRIRHLTNLALCSVSAMPYRWVYLSHRRALVWANRYSNRGNPSIYFV